jgi:hypothetical protein
VRIKAQRGANVERKGIGKSDNRSEARVSEAAALIQDIAGPAPRGMRDSVKAMLRRAHDELVKHGFTWNRVRDLFHGDKRIALRPGELELLRQEAERVAAQDDHDQRRIEKLAGELAALEARILAAREALAPRPAARQGAAPEGTIGSPGAQGLPVVRAKMTAEVTYSHGADNNGAAKEARN